MSLQEWVFQQSHKRWVNWITEKWSALSAGEKIEAPSWLGAPHQAGFHLIPMAHPVGQVRNWGLAMSDGSRIHIHEFGDGRYVAHRDKHDPSRGFESSVAHLMQETPYPAWFALTGLVCLIVRASNG